MLPPPDAENTGSETTAPRTPADPRTHRVRLVLASTLLGVLVLAGVWLRGQVSRTGPMGARSSVIRSRVVAARAERETLAKGAFAGDASCTDCHAEIAASFARHPMGRSLSLEAGFRPDGPLPFRREASFQEAGTTYRVREEGGRMLHSESLLDAVGRPIAGNEQAVEFVIGSGQQGVSFLHRRGDGYLFASPLCWYPREHGWDLAPGYKQDSPHFERPITEKCLFCHANRFEAWEGTGNRYRAPIFRGHSIGCERCHGPGAAHASDPVPSRGSPPNIVNPGRLTATRREGVCQQCHLEGEGRVLRIGRTWTDYRPGQPLHETFDVFVREDHDLDDRFVGQVEQMYASRCFAGSDSALGCISCHDPHFQPEPATSDRYYRARCLACHNAGDGDPPVPVRASGAPRVASLACSVPRIVRLKRSPEDSCIACHMPRSGNRRIAHTTTTDHRIPRNPGAPSSSHPGPVEGPKRDMPGLVSFFQALREADRRAGKEDLIERDRDLGLALTLDPRDAQGEGSRRAPFADSDRLALRLLNRAIETIPDDLDALSARGGVLRRLGRGRDALASFQAGLEVEPESEILLFQAAGAAIELGDLATALPLVDRLIAVNPHRADYFNLLASARTLSREWEAAEAACRASLALNAFDHETRLMLVQSLLQRRDERADSEFQLLLKCDPDRSDFYRQWRAQYRLR